MRSVAVLSAVLIPMLAGCAVSRSASTAPASSALPAAVAAAEPSASRPRAVPSLQRAVAYPHGAWILYGNGSTASPYAWVWVPTAAASPPAR